MKNPGPLIGWILMIGAIAGTVVLGTLPAPYVLESPGPVYDTIGEIQQAGEDKPVIAIEGEKTYDTSGTLDMLTVNLRGSRQTPLSWIDLATVWFDPSRAILPLDAVYPNGETEQQSNEQATADMRDSQQTAVAAALGELDIAFTTTIVVTGTIGRSKVMLTNGATSTSPSGWWRSTRSGPLGTSGAAPAAACKCKFPTVEEGKEGAVAVFEGRVTKLEDEAKVEGGPPPSKRITFQLVRTWKTLEDQEQVTLRTNESSASCGYTFELGKSYLVYAGGEPGALSASSCSRTRPMSEASEDLGVLGAGITPVKVEPVADAGATPPATKSKSTGCATSGSAKASTSAALALFMGAPSLGLAWRRRRRG